MIDCGLMNNVIIREVEEKDLPALKSLIAEAFGFGWNLERYAQNSTLTEALLDIYLSIFLEPAAFGRVAELDGKAVGVVLCSAKDESPKFKHLIKGVMPNTLALLNAAEDERTDITEHISMSFHAITQLLESRVDTYDGSLELFVVTESARGRKLGKTLWNEACGYFDSLNSKSIYLIADEKCNVGFYDNNGFSRVAANEAVHNYTTGQRKNNIFLYEYQF